MVCEDYDYRGVTYEVVMSSRLSVEMRCPRCKQEQKINVHLPFGCIDERRYEIGDKVQWQPDRLPEKVAVQTTEIWLKRFGAGALRAIATFG
jgi:hypothetical protein